MPLYNPQLDDEVLTDITVPISGVNNTLPPSALSQSLAADAVNRLTQLDALNRPRPGIQRLKHTPSSLDSIHHFGGGQFLLNDAANWYKYDHRNNVLSAAIPGGPAFTTIDQVYSALADLVLYFSRGGNLYKFDPATSGFTTVTLPTPYPTALYPTWACNRLLYCWKNTVVVSDILDPEVFDVISSSVTIDPVADDVLTGLALWQDQRIAIFRNGQTWIAETGPGLAVLDWSLNRVSGKVGARTHGTIVQCGSDVYFLSETGRGIYALSQAPSSEQAGVWIPISTDIQGYINRINWTACDNARACFWNDLYLISLPLDGSSYNNFILAYSTTLQKWQGIWCFESATGLDLGFRGAALDKTDVDGTVLLYATDDGIISEQTYPVAKQAFDLNEDLTQHPFEGSLLTRAFTFGEQVNRIRPHSVRLQFLDSADPVNVLVLGDREVELVDREVDTTGAQLQLPISQLPFNLDRSGFSIVPLGLLSTGIYHELQLELTGDGNWTLYQIKASAFEAFPLIAT